MTESPRERAARSGVKMAAAINAVGMLANMIFGLHTPGVPEWPAIASACIGAIVLAAMWRAPDASLRTCSVLFLANSLAVVGGLWFVERAFAQTGLPWVPYQASKLGCLIVAFLAPTRTVGIAAILAHAGSSLLSINLLPPGDRMRIGVGEPMATLGFGVTGIALLFHRIRARELTERLIRANAQQVALAQFTRSMTAIRDLANTPVQTIVLCTELLRPLATSENARLFDRIDHALSRLREINDMIARQQARGGTELESAARELDAAGNPPREPSSP